MFTLTPSAAREIARAAEAQAEGRPMLRVAAKLDDIDGEIVYGMGFDEEREDDQVIEATGVKVLISPRSLPLLDDTTLDFAEVQAGEFQFIFRAGCDGARGPERGPAAPAPGAGD